MSAVAGNVPSLEILVLKLRDLQFCVKITSIREIRGWTPVTPLPHTPPEMIGISNLRGTVIPIIDLSVKLGMDAIKATERSAIVVAEIEDAVIGLMVDGVSDIMNVSRELLQPVPTVASIGAAYSDGIITQENGMICFLNLERMFGGCGQTYYVEAA